MWKYVTRRIRDTFERSANHFDRCSATVVNGVSEEKNKRPEALCRWFCPRKCGNTSENDNNTNSKKGNFDQLNRTWISAITWSSILVLGWYTSQLRNLKYKYRPKEYQKECSITNIISSLYPYINTNKITHNACTLPRIEQIISTITPTVHLVSNNDDIEGPKKSASVSSDSTTNTDSSDDDLGDVLNSIENRLGLAAIENGQHKDGLNLLRSAANRNHAPALYNLGICYEMGLGVSADEKLAMELYRSAAALEHPGALYNLGIYYGQGRGGLTRDVKMATRLLKLAAVQGQKDAIDALKTLEADPVPLDDRNEPWYFSYAPYAREAIPAQTTLFVENINYMPYSRDTKIY